MAIIAQKFQLPVYGVTVTADAAFDNFKVQICGATTYTDSHYYTRRPESETAMHDHLRERGYSIAPKRLREVCDLIAEGVDGLALQAAKGNQASRYYEF